MEQHIQEPTNNNKKIIDSIIRQRHNCTIPSAYLANLFPSMSKETVYRRINNKTLFSVEEAIVIAKDLNLTVGELLGMKTVGAYSFIKGFDFEREPADIFSALLLSDIEIMDKLLAATEAKITAAIKSLPFRLLPYRSLFKLDYCHYLYSTGKTSVMTRYSDVELPDEMKALHEKAIERFRRLNNITCIVDNMMYEGVIKKIQYYLRLKFISAEDLKIIKAELLELLDAYENLLRYGKNESGNSYNFYYSLFNLESGAVFYEYDDHSLLQIRVYPESPLLIRENELICKIQKRWIDLKIRNSAQITKTTDIQHVEILRNLYGQIEKLR